MQRRSAELRATNDSTPKVTRTLPRARSSTSAISRCRRSRRRRHRLVQQRAALPQRRRAAAQGRRAHRRVVNYFAYDYPAPAPHEPFSLPPRSRRARGTPTHRLVRIGLRARHDRPRQRARRSNLVFLVDVSGSMQRAEQAAAAQARPRACSRASCGREDRVAIVVYAGASALALPVDARRDAGAHPRGARARWRRAARPTAAQGIELAYDVAQQNFIKGGINRVDPRDRRRLQRRRDRARASSRA